MKYNPAKAKEIALKYGLSPTTVRVWKKRGRIPDRYTEEADRVLLTAMLTDNQIAAAIDKYGEEMKRLLETRQFKAGQKDAYYNLCLVSLGRECKDSQTQ
jgi:uncharacterized protein YjcR